MSRAEHADLIDTIDQFYNRYADDDIATLAQHYPSENKSLTINWPDLYRYDHDLADDIITHPDTVRDHAEQALQYYDLPVAVDFTDAHVRVTGVEPTDIRALRADHVHTLVAIQGIVRKATPVRPKLTEAAFECQRCGTMTYIPQGDMGFSEPHECQGCERQGPFQINFDQSDFVDAQTIRIQESPEGLRGGETPESIDVYIEDDITGDVSPGDRVTATGRLDLEQRGSGQQKSATFDKYLDGWHIEIDDTEFADIEVSDGDADQIRELAARDDIYEYLRGAIAPTIHGRDDEKLAIGLQLFSGVTKHLTDGSRIRGDIHVFLIGDPGTAKSQLIQYAQTVAPSGVFTSGKGSSAAGLTASAVKDDFGDGSQWSLEAGALVLADQGLAAVDELDKMDPDDRSAMHEGLEQQTISVSKAGINATLKARCSLLAAANPKHGRFDQYESIGEQIDLEPALVSRFDLIFTITDDPDPDADAALADHVLETNHAGELTAAAGRSAPTNTAADPTIEPELLRKYVAYARQHCDPVMTDDARDHIKEFYVDLREKGVNEDTPVPVTARKLEALVRLAEASARIRLADDVAVEDAERAVAIARSCLEDVGIDPETGEYDADVVETGTTKSQRDRIKSIKDVIEQVIEQTDAEAGAPLPDVIAHATDHGMDAGKVEHEVDKLKQQGELYEPETDHLRPT